MINRKLIAIHPGSGSEKKNWPELKWAELIRVLLSDCERNIVLVGGEAEEGRLERLAKTAPVGRVEILRSRPLPELARRLAGTALACPRRRVRHRPGSRPPRGPRR